MWFINDRNHGCGPIADGIAGWDPVIREIEKSYLTRTLYKLLTLFPLLWFILAVLTLNSFLNKNMGSVLESFSKDKNFEYQNQLQDNDRVIRKLLTKINYSKKL